MWPVLLMLLVSRSVFCLDQLLLDDLDIGISMGGWQEVPPPMPAAHELILLPSSLQFPRTNLANIASHAVTLYNNHHNKTVYLNSVFALPLQDGQHNDFHVPFVREQAVPPQGNFTFTIVFLPTQIGAVQTEILMRTSFGQLKYQVQGIGVASPFKVVPLTQLVSYAGVNSNAAIIPDITLYNPYDLPIQITEIFSSGGKFYLELPTREFSKEGAAKDEDPDARTQLWTIAAFEKRPVIRVRFVGSLVAGNYSAYIRMKVKCPDDDLLEDIILVIPIRMEVRALQPISLYPEKSIIDLGSVLLHEKRPLSINLFTSDTPDVGVTSLAWDSQVAVGEATTRFRRILDCSDIVVGEELHVRLKIECDLQWTEVIRNISQQWEDFLPGSVMHISGGITVNSTVGPKKSAQIHRIPLFAEVISGTGIELPRNVTVLYPRNDQASIGIFYLRNNFDSPMVVTGIELVAKDRGSDTEAHPVFKVIVQYLQSAAASDFPKVLKPGESWTMAPADLPMESAADGEGPLRSFVAHLQIATNVTDDVIHVPLYGYSGRLSRLVLNAEVRNVIAKVKGVTALEESKMVTDEQASLIDFGSVRLDVEAHRYIALLNDNPMAVELTKWDMPAMDIIISIFHVGCMNKFDLATNKEAMLQPDDWCVFSFAAKTTRAGEFNGTFQYETNYERNELPIRVRGTAGTLTLDSSSKVMSCIPVSRKKYMVDLLTCNRLCLLPSQKTICITDIIVESSYSDTVQLHDIVTYKEAGVHIFTKEILPNTANKIGRMYFNPRVSKLEPRGYTNGYPSEIFDNTDTKTLLLLQRTATSIYRMLQERQFVLPFQVNTDKQILSSSAAVDFVWPRLISLRDSLRERVVMVGQELVYNISLLNPSHESIAYWYYFTDDRFHISDLFDTPLPYSTDPIQSLLATRVLSTAGNRGTQKFVLPPGKYHNITIHASGKNEPGVYASMFVLKNNFTFFEGSWQKVKIVQPQFKFGNRKPFSTTPLLFEIQDQPNVCTGGGGGAEMVQGQQQQPSQAVVSTRRVFTAKNTGQLPLNIVGISINSEACSGYGFVVLNCDPFVLAPNETHKVEISFVPDFTVSRIDRKIDFHTDVDFGIQYTLVGVVPQTMLERCRSATGRPWWEAGFKKWALSMLATMALIVVTVAFFESLKILKDHSDATYRQRGPFQAPLDFKKLAAMKTISSSSSGGGGGGQDVATKEMTKAPKKKTLPPSTLFNNKRFSWFINRSQQQQQQPVATAQVLSSLSSSSSSSSSAAGQTGQGGVTTAATASNDKKSSTGKSATKNTERIVSATKSTDSKGAAEVSNKKPTAAGGAKKESATTAKKNKSKGKSTAAPATRPAESSEATVTKVEPKVNNEKKAPEIAEPPPAVAVESVQPKRSVEKSVQGPSTLSLDILTAQQQFVAEQTSYSQSVCDEDHCLCFIRIQN